MDDGTWHVYGKYYDADDSRMSPLDELLYDVDCRVFSAYDNVHEQFAGSKSLKKLGIADLVPFRRVKKVRLYLTVVKCVGIVVAKQLQKAF
uniref:Uncharacterized protein n=1 Tax=Panagrolaimus davidi TaxID=227884 RepID=A0A914QDZ8_9BILA